MAELKPQPKPPPVMAPVVERKPKLVKKPKKAKVEKPKLPSDAAVAALPVLSVPDATPEAPAPVPIGDVAPESEAGSGSGAGSDANPFPDTARNETPDLAPVIAPSRLPPHGIIRYRLDRGDRHFEIGVASQEWEIADGRYRLSWSMHTTGIVWLIKSYRVEIESIGAVTPEGLRPESFSIRRNGQAAREKAAFDWEKMTVQVGNRPEQALDSGAQDLLSFNYQLGFMSHSEVGSVLPLATGKKYAAYRLESLGDEDIEVPAGSMRTLHLRVPGDRLIELWLAYDYLLLPVKIRFVESDGDVYVQLATQIQTSPP